ncbi:heparinase II/III family protein [Ruficoccus amylovorans]|uniref:Heparinase II/III family protein n=1 Tax=Ruficoccus amylovorans TaxID=1804625 RepID=A0A842HHF2_9BACT|nr:heparinase II/III family protein [Ruficoccus amylovorans]MBC2596165.1 heparinase II/III family protein [Ruficoccus amylovorans]
MNLPTANFAAEPDVAMRIEKNKDRQHPYLLFPKGEEQALADKIEAEALYRDAYANLLALADVYAAEPPVSYQVIGPRLLAVSREFLRRVEYLAFAYRMSGEKKYLKGAEKEMLAVAAFPSWNPSHFLDVGEMATGMAIGYDWLYDDLSPQVRETVRKAIIEKAIEPGLVGGGWVSTGSNWNQVCNSGLVMASLAVMKDQPEAAATLVERAVKNVPIALEKYEPDGAYPEGPTYWGYGTGYTAIMLEALQTALGETFGLKETNPGFMGTANYYLHVCGPTGAEFNYSDAGMGKYPLEAMPWFAKDQGNPSLMWSMRERIRHHIDEGGNWKHYPLVLLWAPGLKNLQPPAQNHWHADGEVPVSLHRSGWEDDATFFGTRAGKVTPPHSHLDIGSFVLEASGVRWIVDAGMQSYDIAEQAGLNNWDRSQSGDRWKIFRNNNFSHNTLTVNGQLQNVDAEARFIGFSDDPLGPFSIVDMTEVYAGQLDSASRGLKLVNGDSLLVQDEVSTPAWRPVTRVRWAAMTEADIELMGDRVRLRQAGKTLDIFADGLEGVEFRLFDRNVPPAEYDLVNPALRQFGFELELPPGEDFEWRVLFEPRGDGQAKLPPSKPLAEW